MKRQSTRWFPHLSKFCNTTVSILLALMLLCGKLSDMVPGIRGAYATETVTTTISEGMHATVQPTTHAVTETGTHPATVSSSASDGQTTLTAETNDEGTTVTEPAIDASPANGEISDSESPTAPEIRTDPTVTAAISESTHTTVQPTTHAVTETGTHPATVSSSASDGQTTLTAETNDEGTIMTEPAADTSPADGEISDSESPTAPRDTEPVDEPKELADERSALQRMIEDEGGAYVRLSSGKVYRNTGFSRRMGVLDDGLAFATGFTVREDKEDSVRVTFRTEDDELLVGYVPASRAMELDRQQVVNDLTNQGVTFLYKKNPDLPLSVISYTPESEGGERQRTMLLSRMRPTSRVRAFPKNRTPSPRPM